MITADIEDLYELSPLQQGILFHVLGAGGRSLYVLDLEYDLRGALDGDAFARAWQRVVERNPILRTSFHWEDIDKALQMVHRQATLPIERHDWRGQPGL
jgi:surfactin family lipopeptide synthetase C